MIDKTAFLKWVKLPASQVEFSKNGEADPAKPTCYVVVTLHGQKLRYHVQQTGSATFKLGEPSYCSGSPTASFSDDENLDRDASEFTEASCDPVLPADSLEDELAELFFDEHLPTSTIAKFAKFHSAQVEVASETALALNLRSIVALFMMPGNLSLRAWALAFAVGLDSAVGRSMTSVAKELGCTRAAISKETNRWSDLLGLNRSRYMKSEDARKSYSEVQKQNHWRRG